MNILHISIGHGVCYFKYFLYNENRIYGIKKNNKLLLPPSEKIISIAQKHGWKDEDIIKMNLPRWDKYNSNEIEMFISEQKITKNSIFIMFTWRDIKKYKKISDYYLNNINILIDSYIQNINLIKKKNIFIFKFSSFNRYEIR